MLCLMLAALHADISSYCSAVMASAGRRKGLLVFCSPESPELAELRKLPPEFEVVAIGRTEAELSGETLRPAPLASLSTGQHSKELAMHPSKALCCLFMHSSTESS